MSRTRTLLALLAVQLLALGAAAQSDTEFGNAFGGTINTIAKAPRQTSGSLSISRSTGGTGYEGSLGGELLKDRIWFFGAASILPQLQFTAPNLTKIDPKAKATAQPLPASFLSLRATSALSDQTTLHFSFSRHDAK